MSHCSGRTRWLLSATAGLLLAGSAALATEPPQWSTRVTVDPAAVPVTNPGPAIAASPLAPDNFQTPDVAITTQTGQTQSENSIFIDPNNPFRLLVSNNSSNWPVTTIYGADYFISNDGGATWTGSIQGAGGSNGGDPATGINRSGRMFVVAMSSSYGTQCAYSDNGGGTWAAASIAPGPNLDKVHMCVDNSPTSPYAGRLYAAWTNFNVATPYPVEIMRSTTNGTSWTGRQTLSTAIGSVYLNQGVNIQTGPNGEVYVCWVVYPSWPSDENSIGFARSVDGGVTFTSAVRAITNIRGIRNTTLGGGKTMRHNSFPSMTVNQQTGDIYITWTNVGVPGINNGDPDIYMIKSSDGGATWATPLRINQDPIGNNKDQWFPWITVDPVTGLLACAFYDSRDFAANDRAETFCAISSDGGNSWLDGIVSDFSWTADGIPGFSGSYAGDYIGVKVANNQVYPVWSDNHSGVMLAYISPFTGATEVPPVAAFTGTPLNGDVPLNVQFTDQSSGSPTSWLWDFGDGTPTETTQNPLHGYTTPGTYTVTLTATNAYGSDSEIKTNYVTAYPPGTANIHVSAMSIQRGKVSAGSWAAKCSVTIVDETGAPVSGATVYGSFNAPDPTTRSAVTNASGIAVVKSAATSSPPADWCFDVTDVQKPGEVYDPTQSVVTHRCESGDLAAGGSSLALSRSGAAISTSAQPGEIAFSLAETGHVTLRIFDVTGRMVSTLVNRSLEAGNHSFSWSGNGASGIYFYRLEAGADVHSGKLVLMAR